MIQQSESLTCELSPGQALHYCFAFGYSDLGLYLESKSADARIRNEYGLDAREGLEPEETLVNTHDSPPPAFAAHARSASEDLLSRSKPRPSTLDPQLPVSQPSNLDPGPWTRNPQPSTLDPEPATLNPQP